MINVHTLLVVLALVFTLVSGLTNKIPLWAAVLLLCVAMFV